MRKLGLLLLLLMIPISMGQVANVDAQSGDRPAQIVDFTASVTEISIADAEAATESVELAWQMINVDEDVHLVRLQRWSINRWINALSAGDEPAGVDTRTLTIGHTLDFRPPAYRLQLVNREDEAVLSERVLEISYVVAEGTPRIAGFGTMTIEVDTVELSVGVARVMLRWEIADRAPTSNLEFVQLVPTTDGGTEAVNVEQPRTVWWVPGSGTGEVSPVNVPGAESIVIELRVVDVVTGEVYDSAAATVPVVQPVIDLPESTITDEPQPPATETSDEPAPTVDDDALRLTINPQPIQRNAPVSISWNVPDAQTVSVELLYFDGQGWAVVEDVTAAFRVAAAAGNRSITLPGNYRQAIARFRVTAQLLDGTSITRDTPSISLACVPVFYGSAECSTFPTDSQNALYQSYQNGIIIWRTSSRDFIVLNNNGEWFVVADTFVDNEVITLAETAPTGLFTPAGRFAKLWRDNPDVQALGWATGTTTNYTLLEQYVPDVPNPLLDATYISTPSNLVLRLITSPDRISGPSWETTTFSVQ